MKFLYLDSFYLKTSRSQGKAPQGQVFQGMHACKLEHAHMKDTSEHEAQQAIP
jgi:hypothetical protein